jgi:hypothetical protein
VSRSAGAAGAVSEHLLCSNYRIEKVAFDPYALMCDGFALVAPQGTLTREQLHEAIRRISGRW